MNSVFVYCEIEEGTVADVSLELLTNIQIHCSFCNFL